MKYKQRTSVDPSTLTKVCEECGKEFQIKDGFSLSCFWLVTGHPLVAAFPCEQTEFHYNSVNSSGPQNTGQHWGCCPDHAISATVDCLQNSMKSQLISKHDKANNKSV